MKQFSYKGNPITASSKEEAIQQIIASNLFVSTVNDITILPLNINKDSIVKGILSILFKPGKASLSFADSKGNHVEKQISYESFENCAAQVSSFVNSNWNVLEAIFKSNKDDYTKDEVERQSIKNAARDKKMVTYERNKEKVTFV